MIRFALMCALTVFILLFSAPESASASDPVPPPSMAADTGQEALLDALIVHSRSVMQIGLDGLDGEGADLIRTLAGPSQFVVFGEAHGNAGIAHFATALWQELRRDGFRYAVVEADPWTASALERELRLGGIDGWAQFAEDSGGALSAPFFTWREEAAWADAIVSSAGADASPSLWGVDQVFVGSAPALLAHVAQAASGSQASQIAGELASAARGDPFWLAQADDGALSRLEAALDQQPALRSIISAVRESREIYAPFIGQGGEPYLSNDRRERLMRRLFLQHYRAAQAAGDPLPRVVARLGGSHAHRGASPLTQVQGIGGFLTELALSNEQEALTLLVLCGPGAEAAQALGPPVPCDAGDYMEGWSFIYPYLDQNDATVFDLRAWRLRPGRWSHLSAHVQRLIASFDLLIFPAPAPAAELLPGLSTPSAPEGR